jgi:hypothetical protein
MQFTPTTEQEIAEKAKLWPRGDYEFLILDASEEKSAKGNAMLELKISISNGSGSKTLTDFLLPQRAGKLLHCCEVCGVREKYFNGCVSPEDFPGKRGRLRLGVEKGRKGFATKNVVIDYISETGAAESGFRAFTGG